MFLTLVIILSVALILAIGKLVHVYYKRREKNNRSVHTSKNSDGSMRVCCFNCGWISVVPKGSTMHWCENRSLIEKTHLPCNNIIFSGGKAVKRGQHMKMRGQ